MPVSVNKDMIGTFKDGIVNEPTQCAVTGELCRGRHLERHNLDGVHFYFVMVKARHLLTQERHAELLALVTPVKKTVKKESEG